MDEIKINVEKEALTPKMYPAIEELVIRVSVNSESQAYETLKCIQAVVNELGADTIVALVRKIEKDPSILVKAQKYLPYLNMI